MIQPPEGATIVGDNVVPIGGKTMVPNYRDLGGTCDGDPPLRPKCGWSVKDLIPAVGVGILAGQLGMYKTYTALDLCLSLIIGIPFATHEVEPDRQGAVVMFAPEGAELIEQRWDALKKAKAEPWFGDGQQHTLPFFWFDQVPQLTHKTALDSLRVRCQSVLNEIERRKFDCKIAIIVIDTLSAAGAFDDPNDAGEAQKVMNLLKQMANEFQCFVLAIDHLGKIVERGIRGSTAKPAAADIVITVLGDKDANDGIASNLRIVISKLRGGRSGQKVPFNATEVKLNGTKYADKNGEGIGELVINWNEPCNLKEPAKQNKACARVMAALNEALEAFGYATTLGVGWPTLTVVSEQKVLQKYTEAYPPTGDELKHKRIVQQSYRRGMVSAKECGLLGSKQLESNEILVWNAKSFSGFSSVSV